MTTTRTLTTLAAAVAVIGATAVTFRSSPGVQARPAATRPNIILVLSDDHGAQTIGAYGSARGTTPAIDRLASEGMRFDSCFVTNAICAPSRATLLTGLHTHITGHTTNERIFDNRRATFPELLQQAGYQTALIGKWHLNVEPRGFDHWDILVNQGTYYNPDMIRNGERLRREGYTTDIITELTIEWLAGRRDRSRPFLLLSQHKATHRGWDPALRHIPLFMGSALPEPTTLFDDWSNRSSAWSHSEMSIERHLNRGDLHLDSTSWQLTDEQRAVWDPLYREENEAFERAHLAGKALTKWKYQRFAKDYLRTLASMDEGIGVLLSYLDSTGLSANTIVIYSSDQGWLLGEHGMYDKRWMYEDSLRTPLLVRWPGVIEPGSVNHDLVQNIDLAQTVLELAGVPEPEGLQGRSLVPLMAGSAPEDWRKSIYYHFYESEGAHKVPRHEGVRTDRYKLIHYYRLGEWEMFDLQEDPEELVSVFDDPSHGAVRGMLEAQLHDLRARYRVTDESDAEVDRFQLSYERRSSFLSLLGRRPVAQAGAPTLLGREDLGSYTRETIAYRIGDDRIEALVLVPKGVAGLRPGVVAIHPGTESGGYAAGKSLVAGVAGDPAYAYGLELVRRGFVVICADRFGFESRRLGPTVATSREVEEGLLAASARSLLVAGSSLMARELAEIDFAADYLSRRSEVHALRVGIIGAGEGGLLAAIAAGENESIRAGSALGGVQTLAEYLSTDLPDAGLRTRELMTIPRLREWGDTGAFVTMIYPRPFLVVSRHQGADALLAEAELRYRDLDMSDRLGFLRIESSSGPPAREACLRACDWLGRWLEGGEL
jgi:arylsulfatase A-like enzyme/dienelactone hydrolase